MEGIPRRRVTSAGAENRAAEFSFANETMRLNNQEEVKVIDDKIAALRTRMREGSKFREKMTSPAIIAVAEKAENDINAEIAELEKQKAEKEGRSAD